MDIDPNLINRIKEMVDEKVSKSIESVQLDILRKEFLTRQDFLDAMERIDKKFEKLLEYMDKRFEQASKERIFLKASIDSF